MEITVAIAVISGAIAILNSIFLLIIQRSFKKHDKDEEEIVAKIESNNRKLEDIERENRNKLENLDKNFVEIKTKFSYVQNSVAEKKEAFYNSRKAIDAVKRSHERIDEMIKYIDKMDDKVSMQEKAYIKLQTLFESLQDTVNRERL